MDEKDFKKHLRDLVHGHHHPAEHDWSPEAKVRSTRSRPRRTGAAKSGVRKRRAR